MKWFVCLSILIGLSASSFAQDDLSNVASAQPEAKHREQVKGEIDRLFNSLLTKDRAWAIYLSGKYGLQEYVPAIFEVLEQSSGRSQENGLVLGYLALDSLIQLDARLPAEDLMPIYERFPDAVTILLAKAPKENQQALLAIARKVNPQETNRPYWLAPCNLLAETEAKEFAAYLLREMTINLLITVTDNAGIGGSDGRGFSVGCGFGSYPVPEDFPPLTLYVLSDQAKAGSVVIAPGPTTIFYEREAGQTEPYRRISAGRSHNSWDKNEYLLGYFAALLKTPVAGLPVTNNASRWLEWKTSSHYKQMVAIFRSELERGYAELKGRLIERELLTTAESEGLKPKIIMRVNDYRGDKRIKLPDISGEVKSAK
jgi:hypothetical protein